VAILELLLEADVGPYYAQLLLQIALEQENPVMLKTLLDARGPNSVWFGTNGRLLPRAIETRKIALVEILLEAGSDLSVLDSHDVRRCGGQYS
jgi:hypothetical protein